jgi:hypothetical protein
VLGFAAFGEAEIEEGVQKLARLELDANSPSKSEHHRQTIKTIFLPT